jgi:hypothetical protein
MAFSFGNILQTLGHNFMQNARAGTGMDGLGGGSTASPLGERMMQAAQLLKGQPMGAGQGQGQGDQDSRMALLAALQRLGGAQPQAALPSPPQAPPGSPLAQTADQVTRDLGAQTGLPLIDPSARPTFAQMFGRFGGQY